MHTPQRLVAADPGIRLAAMSDAFGDRGVWTTVCQPEYDAFLVELGTHLRDRLVGQPCLRKSAWDSDAHTTALDASCELEVTGIGVQPVPLAACDATASNPPCWRLVSDATCGAAPADLRIDAVGLDPVQGRHVQGRCQVVP
jgi:hypothetical protein